MDRSIRRSRSRSRWFVALEFGVAGAMSIAPVQAQNLCGGVEYPFPYTDVSAVGAAFCPGIMEAYVTGVSKGTTPTTFSPNNTVTRVEMTTFLQRSLDQSEARTSRRAALDEWWTQKKTFSTTAIGDAPFVCGADGETIWTSTFTGNNVVAVQASTGLMLAAIPGATRTAGVRVVGDRVYIANATSPGALSYILLQEPLSFGAITISQSLGNQTFGVAYDGYFVWTANRGPPGSVSIVDAEIGSVTTVTTGFASPYGILYDGAHIWVTDTGAGTLLKLDSSGNILQTVTVGSQPAFPVFDGANIWVPNYTDSSITVVQASTGNVVATITSDASNQLDGPNGASFDGERILVANYAGNSVTLFKAADLSFIANMSTGNGTKPTAACSDGINFWVPLQGTSNLLRF